jgi:hypothetical protein
MVLAESTPCTRRRVVAIDPTSERTKRQRDSYLAAHHAAVALRLRNACSALPHETPRPGCARAVCKNVVGEDSTRV